MADKLSLIADCLLLKGQNVPATEDDGSQEWNVCSAAYEHGVKHLIQEHDWNFGTAIETLTRSGDSTDADYEDVYPKPNGCLHLMWVRVDDVRTDEFRIIGNAIYINADEDTTVQAKFVEMPGAEDMPPMFISALNELIYAAIEGGLKKDAKEARNHQAAAVEFLQRAKTRSDQEEPKRSLFKFRMRTARRFRRGV